MNKSNTLLFFMLLFLGCQNTQKNKNNDKSTLETELTKAIRNTAWIYMDLQNDFLTVVDFSNNNQFEIITKSFDEVIQIDLDGNWHIENDFIKINYKNGNVSGAYTINEDFSTITNNKGVEFTIIESKKKINLSLNDLKKKYNYSSVKGKNGEKSFNKDPIEDDSPQEYLDRNSIVEPKTNYKVQVKKGVVNVNVRDNVSRWTIDPNAPVITQVSDPEVYTVINYKNSGDRIKGEFELNRQLKLKDINSGEFYTLEIEQKVKLLKIDYETVVYLAEVEVNNKTIKVKTPTQYVEPIYDEKWLYLKELKGWARSDLFKIIDDDSLDKIKTKSNSDGTVTIGNQTWANKDLRVKKYANGDPIFEARNEKQWIEANSSTQGCFYILKNDTFIYNGYAVKDNRGIAPKGFSVPSITDFHTLFFNLGGKDKAENVLTNYVGYTPNEDYLEGGIIDDLIEGNNSIGFNGEPGGSAYSSSSPSEGNFNAWWTNSQIAEDEFMTVNMSYSGGDEAGGSFSAGNAIRAIKNKNN